MKYKEKVKLGTGVHQGLRVCVCLRKYLYMTAREVSAEMGVHTNLLLDWENKYRKIPYKRYLQYRAIITSYFSANPFAYPPEMTPREHIRWMLCAWGVTQKELSAELGIAADTLRRKLREDSKLPELDYERTEQLIRKLGQRKARRLKDD